MNVAAAVPLDAEFFNERGLPKDLQPSTSSTDPAIKRHEYPEEIPTLK